MTKKPKIMVSHGTITHPINEPCEVCKKAEQEFKNWKRRFVECDILARSSLAKSEMKWEEGEVYISGKVVRELLKRFQNNSAVGLYEIKVKAFIPKLDLNNKGKKDLADLIKRLKQGVKECQPLDWYLKEYDKLKQFISQQRTELIKEIENLIVEEINTCHKEGTATSRLTSLALKIGKLTK